MEDTPIIPSETLPERAEDLVQGQRVAKLDPAYKIAAVWPEPPNREHLHIVALPSGSSGAFCFPSFVDQRSFLRRREVLDDDQPSPKRLRLDYRWPYGWLQLSDDDPWKLFGDYWRKKNVETMSAGRSIAFAYDEREEERDPGFRLRLVPETENKILVRECYVSLYQYIFKLRRSRYTGLVLTGQPGTGAPSSWLLVMSS